MAERVTSLFGGHRQPADRPPASWPRVQPAACLQSFGYATVTSSAPSSSTEPARRDTDDSLTSYLRSCRHSYRLRYRRSRPFNQRILGLPSVDAPLQARENVGVVLRVGRMLSSVRPLMRQDDSRRPVWEFADRIQITRSVLEAQWKALVVPAPSRRL